MIAKVFAVALTLAATADADNCAAAWPGAAELKPDDQLSTTSCDGSVVDECTTDKCDCNTCCKPKSDTCASAAQNATGGCGSGKEFDTSKMSTEFKSGDTFADKCCKTKANPTCASAPQSCDSGKAVDMNKQTTEVTEGDAADWKTKCCSDAPKCSDFDCTGKVGYKGAKNNSASINCLTAPSCTAAACCEADSTKCLGVSMSKQCSSSSAMPESKYGEAATAADFQDKCCTPFAKCTAFKGAVLKGKSTTAGAKQQHSGVTLSLLFAVIGGLVMA